ncbi:CYTH domain-containing protein [Pseudoneobacillus sp. C159]
MSQELEIEFKNLLTKLEYEKIKTHFQLDNSQFLLQVNHYFDTPTFSLKEKHSALRIRKKADDFELTLKQPASVGLLETNQILTAEQAHLAITENIIPDGEIIQLIHSLKIDSNTLRFFGTLSTIRAEWEYRSGLLVLDRSYYLNTEDYELEYEVIDFEEGQKNFIELLSSMEIPVRKTENKIKRFYKKKYQELNQDQTV